MSSRMKLTLNLIAIVVVFSIIAVSIGALLTKYSHFLDVPGTRPEAEELSMEIKGNVNGESYFTISFENGKKTQNVETIDYSNMTFTPQRLDILFDMSFENMSSLPLHIKITGIYLDEINFPNTGNKRFETSTYVNEEYRQMTNDPDGTGTIILILEPKHANLEPNLEDGSLINFTIKYTLVTGNRNIEDAKQNLIITISKERFDLED